VDTLELYSITLCGIPRATAYDILNMGELPSVVIGRRRFVPAAAIAAFIATSATTNAPSEVKAKGPYRAVQMSLPLDVRLP
jgi:hypothetical protein